MPRWTLSACLMFAWLGTAGAANPVAGGESKLSAPSALSAGKGEALAGALRELLLQHLPTPLYEASPGWGHTVKGTTGFQWSGDGLHVHPRAIKGEKNDGTWKKIRITAENLPGSLTLDVRNVEHPEPGQTTFEVLLTLDARADYEQQKWKAGIRLFSGRARARFRVQLVLDCKLNTRLEWKGNLTPDAVFRLHIVRSDLTYSQVVVEHILGVGGETAKLLGEAIQRGIHQWRPSLERNLMTKANAAIEKAAEKKEIRIGLGALLK